MKRIIVALLVCCAFVTARAANVSWLTDLPKAESQAKNENKLVLMNFTGSDWCPWCIKLDEDVLSKPEFTDYAQTNLVLMRVDFPRFKEQPDSLRAANADLAQKYGVQGFPTLVAVKPDGTQVWTQTGYPEGGPQALIKQLDGAGKI
jgi:protein disulfide-isomerase